jgi:hypothetical protein
MKIALISGENLNWIRAVAFLRKAERFRLTRVKWCNIVTLRREESECSNREHLRHSFSLNPTPQGTFNGVVSQKLFTFLPIFNHLPVRSGDQSGSASDVS